MVSSQGQAQSGQRDQGYDILLAFKEWLKVQEARVGRAALHPDGYDASDRHDDLAREEFHFSPGIAAEEPSTDANHRQASLQRDGISSYRPSVGRRVFRTVAGGFMITLIVAAALAWQNSDDKTKDTVRAWGVSLSRLLSALRTESAPGSNLAAAPDSKASDQAQAQDAAPQQAAPAKKSAAASVGTGSSPELQHQLETMVSDLAIVRRIVEQLAARQEQMAQDIAALQAADQNVVQKISSLSQSPAIRVPPRRTVPRVGHSETAVQSPAVPVPARPAQAPLPLH